MKSGSLDTANIGCILNCNSLMVKNARRKGRPPSACPSLYLYIWGSVRALFFICHGVGANPHRPPHAYTYIYGETVRALPFVCHGVGASPHRPPPPFLVLTQEKAPAGAGKFAWYIRRDRARDEIRKTCVATLRFGHSDFRARPCNSSFRALGDRCRSSGRTMGDGWSDG